MTEQLHNDEESYTRPTYRDVRRLTRRRDGRKLAGVASGLAAHFNVDPLILRLAFVGLSFANGLGLFLYALLWILVPREPVAQPAPLVPTSGGGNTTSLPPSG